MTTTRRRFDQNTLHARDTIIRIRREDISKVIEDIGKDERLTGVQLEPAELDPNSSEAKRYEVYADFMGKKEKSVATALRGDAIYMVSFNIIPQRYYEDEPEKRETAEVVMEALKETFNRYKFVEH